MALNIRPFDFNYQNVIRPNPVLQNLGPPDMSKQLQEGIAGILPALGEAYKGVKSQQAAEEAAGRIAAGGTSRGAQATTLAAPGGPYSAATHPQTQYDATKALSPDIEKYVKETAAYTGLPEDYFRNLIKVESAGKVDATNPLSSAKGLTQFTDPTWKLYGQGGDPMNPQHNIAAAGRLALANKVELESALGRPATPAELYLAHQQGATKTIAALQNPDAKAVDIYGLKQVKNNGGNENMTVAQFNNLWTGKFGGTGAAPAAATVATNATRAAPGAAAVSSGNLSDPALAYKTRIQEQFPQVKITSEYRDYNTNQKVGGRSGSQHLTGNALDINTAGMSDEQKAALIDDAIANGAKGIGWYNANSMHIDFRPTPMAWGPDTHRTSLGQTPPWFQERANKLLASGGTAPAPAAASGTPGQAAAPGAVPPVAPGAPQAVAAAVPGSVPRTPPAQGQTASAEHDVPLFNAPATGAAAAAAQPPYTPAQLAGGPQMGPTPQAGGAPQGLAAGGPTPEGAPLSAAAGQVAGPGVPNPPVPAQAPPGPTFADVLSNPDLPPAAAQYFNAVAQNLGPAAATTPVNPSTVMADPSAPPEAKQVAQVIAGGRNAPRPPPRPPAATAAAAVPPRPPVPDVSIQAPTTGPRTTVSGNTTPAPATPAATVPAGGGGGGGDPGTTGGIAARLGLSPNTAAVIESDPNLRLALAAAIRSRDPAVIQGTLGAIDRLSGYGKDGASWTYHKDSKTGEEIRFNSRTGERQVITPGRGPQGQDAFTDRVLQPGDPERDKYTTKNDPRPWRLTTDDKGNVKPEPLAMNPAQEKAQEIATGLEGTETYKKHKERYGSVMAMEAALAEGGSLGDFNATLQAFKVVDPGSTVTTNEQGGIKILGGSEGILKSWKSKLDKNGGFLTEEMRAEMYNAAIEQAKATYETGGAKRDVDAARRKGLLLGRGDKEIADMATNYHEEPTFERRTAADFPNGGRRFRFDPKATYSQDKPYELPPLSPDNTVPAGWSRVPPGTWVRYPDGHIGQYGMRQGGQ